MHEDSLKMKVRAVLVLAAMACAAEVGAQEGQTLRLVTTIPLPQLNGRFDHYAADLERQRLFIALRDGDTVEVIDLRTGKVIKSIPGFSEPQGVFYVPLVRKLFVTSRKDGTCRVISGDSLKVVDAIPLSFGANVIAYDPRTRYLYIGHGGRQVGDNPTDTREPGQIAIVDAASGRKVGNIETDPQLRPGAIVIDPSGPRLFTPNALAGEVIVIDRSTRKVLSKWKVPDVERSGTLALDPIRRRLFVGTRNPALVFVFNADSGERLTSFPTVDGIDRLLYGVDYKRLYATGSPKAKDNVGSIEVYDQLDADRYQRVAKIPTGPDGGTSLLVPQARRLYVALPRSKERDAEIRVYDTRP